MSKKSFYFYAAFCLAIISTNLSAQPSATNCSAQSGLAKVVCLTEAFKGTLTKDQVALLQLEYSKGDAARWSNFPQAFARPGRVGLSFGSLNSTQLAAAKALMGAVLSNDRINEGFDELEGELAADDFFGQKTGNTKTFGSGYYVIVFLGKPSTTGLWELMFGGHHFAFANTYNAGKITGATPSFRGVEPEEPVKTGDKTYQPLAQERIAFSEVIKQLTDKEKQAARISKSFNDILLGPGEDGQFPATKQGLRIGSLNQAQQNQIIEAIKLYVGDLDRDAADLFMKKYISEMADTYLSYSGSGTMNQVNDYIRLDGPGLWIEYSAQSSRDFPGSTHPHSVWRDHKTDYGAN